MLCYYYNRFTAPWTVSRTTQMSWYQKGKTNLELLEQEIVSGSGISHSRDILGNIKILNGSHDVTIANLPFSNSA